MVAVSERMRATSRRRSERKDASRALNGSSRRTTEGPDGQRPGERDALLLAARELMGVAPGQLAQPDQVQQLAHPVALVAAQPEADVAAHREVGEQRALLGDVAHAAVLGGYRAASVVDDAGRRS